MRKNISVQQIDYTPVARLGTEIVERKGVGHPDSIADGLAESVSRALCKMYIEEYGTILHHNTDETQIVGGQSNPAFGGGTILEPVYILLVGRATTDVLDRDGKLHRLPYNSVALEAAKCYLEVNFPNLDIRSDVTIDTRIGKGSVDLMGVYDSGKRLANDTSFGVGFAPFSPTETVVLEVEKYINDGMKREVPGSGQDVKVMGSRLGNKLQLTVACAMVDKYFSSPDEYRDAIAKFGDLIGKKAYNVLDGSFQDHDMDVEVFVNTADILNSPDPDDDIFYLTVTGLSMENGDDGSVGRGNRANGLITPYRPMSMEASAGKNPVTHVGKLYNILSIEIANRIAKAAGGEMDEVRVRLLSQIDKPISDPLAANVQFISQDPDAVRKWSSEAESITAQCLDDIDKLTMKIINGERNVF